MPKAIREKHKITPVLIPSVAKKQVRMLKLCHVTKGLLPAIM
jgi:hypothetical protein